MTLTPGTRLGSYEVLSPLGAGGMGEVYRARDNRLGREVALKVLPERLAADPAALQRFESEARAVAALSHPNILAIHDFGSIDGRAFAVTELLEGRTLAEAVAEGPLPLRKALDVAAQTARGLAAAHARGIVHRDLKPANLFLTRDGRVKILDFGLARQEEAPDSHSAIAASPTVLPLTAPGTVLGTVGYMSPEQVRGERADPRSDLFSLGAVLYELVSGRRAFARDTAAETMTAILREDPPELGAAAPPAVAELVRRCLEKSPEERFHSAHDLGFALAALAGGPTSGSGVAAGGRDAPRRGAVNRLGIAALATAIAGAAFVAGHFWRRGPAAPAAAPRPAAFTQLTDAPGAESSPSLSPDGKSVVYVAVAGGHRHLYLQRVGGRNPVPLTADSGVDDFQPAFSPDGDRIAFRSERDGGGIFLMGSTGESVKRLTDYGFSPTWSPDGKEIAVAQGMALYPTDRASAIPGLWAVEVATGRRRTVTDKGDTMQPAWSPHGQRIAFWGLRGTGGQRDLWTIAADGSESDRGGVEVTNDPALDWSPTWSPDGHYLYFSSTRGGTMNLWRVPIAEVSGKVLGPAEPMTTPSSWSGEMSFARDGAHFAYASLDWRSTLVKLAFDPKTETAIGEPVPLLRTTQPMRDHALSPDGQWVAFAQTGGQEDIFVARTDGSEYRRLTDDAYRDRSPTWSPDGKLLTFYSDRSGGYQVWTIRPDGSGLAQLTQIEGSANFPLFSPDGRHLVLSAIGARGQQTKSGWYLMDMESPTLPRPLRFMPSLSADEIFWPFSWTRDGAKVAGVVVRGDGTAGGVAIFTFAGERFARIPSGSDPFFKFATWLSDGRRLIVRDVRGISLVDSESQRTKPIFAVGGYWIGRSIGVTPDDRWITFTETGTEGDIWLAELR